MTQTEDVRKSGLRDARATPDDVPIGRLYEVEGRRLLLHHSGEGSPSVVLLPGAGTVGLDYLNIHNEVSAFTTSVIYDRAGTGWSDKVELPRTANQVTDELQSLLSAAGVPAPYLLVGHSLGGFYAQRYAQRFPNEVAGLLLLDPAHRGYYTDMPKKELLGQLGQLLRIVRLLLHMKAFYRRLFERMYRQWPASIRDTLIEYHLRSLWTGLNEGKNIKDELFAETPQNVDATAVPLILLSSMGVDAFQLALQPETDLREINQRKRVFYTALAESVPHGEHRMLENAGHATLYISHSDAVVQAIRDLLGRISRVPVTCSSPPDHGQ